MEEKDNYILGLLSFVYYYKTKNVTSTASIKHLQSPEKPRNKLLCIRFRNIDIEWDRRNGGQPGENQDSLPPTPIEQLFRQLKSCMVFTSKGGDVITQTSTVWTGIYIIENNGIFSLDY